MGLYRAGIVNMAPKLQALCPASLIDQALLQEHYRQLLRVQE